MLPCFHEVCTGVRNDTAVWLVFQRSCQLYILSHVKRAYSQSDWVLLAVFEFVAVLSHITMNCCLLWYCPNLWYCQHCCAAWIDASHSCFDSIGYWSTVAFELCSKWSMSQASCCAPPVYAASIWVLTVEWSICCWSCLPKWSSLLWWSHISHSISHNFWISTDIHLQLDFLKQIWLHTCSLVPPILC